MSLLKEAYKSLNGLVGYQPTEQERLAELYAQRSGVQTPTQQAQPQTQPSINTSGGVMNASVQSPIDQMEEEAYGAPRQEGWKLGDTYTRLSSLFGENVHSTPRLLGTPSTWEEFGDQTTKTFKEFGLKVDKKRLFPTLTHLSASEGRDIPYGNKTQGREFHEMNWLNRDRDTNIKSRSASGWSLIPQSSNRSDAGLMAMVGLTSPSYDSYNPSFNFGDQTYIGVNKTGASLSRGKPSKLIEAQAPNFEQQMSLGYPAEQNITGHEYGHYLDTWMGKGEPLSDIVKSLGVTTMQPTAHDWYEAWMNDPRTAHLDVVDNINTVMQGAKVNNPREILGKLYVTAMLNPTRTDGQPFGQRNMEENIARAMGVFFNPDQSKDEGHIQGIKDMRRDVMTSIANLLNQ